MGLLSFITGAGKAGKVIDTMADGLTQGIDKLILTEEEKLDYSKQAAELWLEMQRVTATENTARSLTRRYIAVAVAYSWLLAIGVWVAGGIGGWTSTVSAAGAAVTEMNMPVITVFFFYFGGNAAQRLIAQKGGVRE